MKDNRTGDPELYGQIPSCLKNGKTEPDYRDSFTQTSFAPSRDTRSRIHARLTSQCRYKLDPSSQLSFTNVVLFRQLIEVSKVQVMKA